MAAQNTYRSQAYTPQNQQLEQVFKQQQDFVTQLQQAAQGQGPSAATAMLQQAQQANTAQANALAASQQGNINAGLATRNAMQQAAQANQAATGQAQVMRNQEQLQARQMLGGQLGTMMGQGMAGQQAKDTLNANIEQKNVDAQNAVTNSVTGGLMGIAGGVAAGLVKSDERAKTDIKDGSTDIHKFLDALHAQSYHYKDPSAPGASPGQHTSVMAQDLEKTPVGSQMVKEAPNGLKMVDYGQGLAAILAAQADLHKRLKAVEGGKRMMSEGGGVAADDDKIPVTVNSVGQDVNKYGMVIGPHKSPEQRLGEGTKKDFERVYAAGGPIHGETLAAQGKLVPGKPKVKGDSLQNDTVDAKLSPGEIIIPRSIAQHPDAVRKSAEFVAQVLARKRGR